MSSIELSEGERPPCTQKILLATTEAMGRVLKTSTVSRGNWKRSQWKNVLRLEPGARPTESLPDLDVTPALALIIEAVDSGDVGGLVVASVGRDDRREIKGEHAAATTREIMGPHRRRKKFSGYLIL